jgi:rubrerythrin
MKKISTLQIAIDNEAREETYYLAQASRTRNPVVKELLTHLAAEEFAHQKWIVKRHEYMLETGQWPEEIAQEKGDLSLSEALKQLDYHSNEAKAHDDDDIACLNRAAQFEMEAADFYFRLAKEAANEKEQAFFFYLGKLEQDHMASIRDSLAYLEDPEAYFSARAEH